MRRKIWPAAALTAMLLLPACGGDDGADVRTIDDGGSGSGSGSSGSGADSSGSGSASTTESSSE